MRREKEKNVFNKQKLLSDFVVVVVHYYSTKQRKTRRFFFVFLLCFVCFVIFVCVLILRVFLWCQYPSKQMFWKRRRELWSAKANTGEKCNSLIVWHSIRKFQSRIELLFLQNYKNVLIWIFDVVWSRILVYDRWALGSAQFLYSKVIEKSKKKKNQQISGISHGYCRSNVCWHYKINENSFEIVIKCSSEFASIKIALLPHAFVPNESSSSALNITHSKLVYCCSHWILSPNDR